MIDHDSDLEFETNDIYYAAYLMVSGCSLAGQRRQGSRVYFKFKNPIGSFRELKNAYYTGTARVNPHEYSQKLIACKALLFE
jgi:hypothetical protein